MSQLLCIRKNRRTNGEGGEAKLSRHLYRYIYVYKKKGIWNGHEFQGKSWLPSWMDCRSVLGYVCISEILPASGTMMFSPFPSRSGPPCPFPPRSRLKAWNQYLNTHWDETHLLQPLVLGGLHFPSVSFPATSPFAAAKAESGWAVISPLSLWKLFLAGFE